MQSLMEVRKSRGAVVACLALSSLVVTISALAADPLGQDAIDLLDTLGVTQKEASPTGPAEAPSAHPTGEDLADGMDPGERGTMETPETLLPDDPPDSPLASGSFINFESPQTKPIALSSDGSRLFVTNTPNNSLAVFDTTLTRLAKIDEIPVGLDPVAVAIQPATNDNIAWVANFISDNIAIVDIAAGNVIGLVEVGDEPVNILFNPAGTTSFIIIQGSPVFSDVASPVPIGAEQEGCIVAVDTAPPYAIIRSKHLNANTPRAAVYDAAMDRIVVAALHSGNNTSVAGEPVSVQFLPPGGACCLTDAGCVDTDEFDCFNMGGNWQGAGSDCATAGVCDGPFEVPVPPNDPCNCQCTCISLPNFFAFAIFNQTFPPTPADIFNAGALSP